MPSSSPAVSVRSIASRSSHAPRPRPAEWNHSSKLQEIYERYSESFTRSAAVLALGVAGIDHWFRTERERLSLMDPWEHRAFLAGAACLPKDERKHWYASVKPQLSPLELAVVEWAKANAPQ